MAENGEYAPQTHHPSACISFAWLGGGNLCAVQRARSRAVWRQLVGAVDVVGWRALMASDNTFASTPYGESVRFWRASWGVFSGSVRRRLRRVD